jgi:hypothetical protein
MFPPEYIDFLGSAKLLLEKHGHGPSPRDGDGTSTRERAGNKARRLTWFLRKLGGKKD